MKIHLEHTIPYLLVAIAAVLWGGIGIFVEALDGLGFSSLQIVALRVSSATVMLLLYLLFRNPNLLRIDPKDFLYFVGTGVFSIAFFNWCYFTAIKEITLSVAVILLYTGPAFVVIMSRIFFGEKFTFLKISALVLTTLGCTMVVGLIPVSHKSVSLYGILIGLGSGFGYALYSIFGKTALKKYSPVTILFYTFLLASIVMLPLSGLIIQKNITLFSQAEVLGWTLGLGFIPTILAYLLYTQGLAQIEASKASVTALLEPVAATIFGVIVFNETVSLVQLTGIVLVLSSVMLIQLRTSLSRILKQFL